MLESLRKDLEEMNKGLLEDVEQRAASIAPATASAFAPAVAPSLAVAATPVSPDMT